MRLSLKKKSVLLSLALVMCASLIAAVSVFGNGTYAAAAPTCTNTGIHIDGFNTEEGLDGWTDSAARRNTDEGMQREGDASLSYAGLGVVNQSRTYASKFDLSKCDSVSLWIYVSNAASFKAMGDGQLEFAATAANRDSDEFHWSLKTVAQGLKDGWNFVTLPFAESEKSGTADWNNIGWVGLYFVGISGDPITVAFDDLHANSVAGLEMWSFDAGFDSYSSTVDGKVGKATDMSGDGWINSQKLPAALDLSRFDAISMWIYCERESDVTQVAGLELELTEVGSRNDSVEYSWAIPASSLKVGWSQVILKFTDAKDKLNSLEAINNVSFVKPGLSGVRTHFDDLRAVETKFLAAPSTPMTEPVLVLECDKIVSGVFGGMTLESNEHKQGVAAYTSPLAAGDNVKTAVFSPVKTGLALTGENMLGMSFWFYAEDLSKLASLNAEISSSKNVGSYALKWNIPTAGLISGWNWIVLKADSAVRAGGVIDADAVSRITVSAAGTDPASGRIMLDRFSIVNCSTAGYDTQPSEDEKRTYNPVDRVVMTDAEDETADFKLKIDENEYKQGYSSAIFNKTDNKESSTVGIYGKAFGKTELFAKDYNGNNELGVTLWLYVQDVSKVDRFVFLLGKGANAGELGAGAHLEFQLASTALVNGWNWVVLKASAAEFKNGDADTDDLNAFQIVGYAKAAESAFSAFSVRIDRLSLVNAAKPANIAVPPASEKLVRNPIASKIIIDCDSVSGTKFPGNSVETGGKQQQGTGCVRTEGAGVQLTAKELSVGKTDLSKNKIVLAFWLYVDTAECLTAEGANGQAELSSSGDFDKQELAWELKNLSLTDGWNWVVLKGSDSSISGGTPDFDNLSRFRIYINTSVMFVMKLDRVTIACVSDPANYAQPDPEKERAGGSDYVGQNGQEASNNTFLETEIAGEEFTYLLTATEGGCNSSGSAVGLLTILCLAAGIGFKRID